MKTLNFIVALLLCTQAYGQDFDFNDLKVIDSKEEAKRFCSENNFNKIYSQNPDWYLDYAYKAYYQEDAYVFFSLAVQTGGWDLSIYWKYNGLYEKILEQVKNQCTFVGIEKEEEWLGGDEWACYSCPSARFTGKIKFSSRPYANLEIINYTPPKDTAN